MSIAAALASHLKEDTDIAATVGARVYRNTARQDAPLPYIVIRQINADHVHHLTAASGIVRATFQVDAYAVVGSEADALAELIRLSLDVKHHSTMGLEPNVEPLTAASLQSAIGDFIPPRDASDVGVDIVHQTWEIWHTETVPTFS